MPPLTIARLLIPEPPTAFKKDDPLPIPDLFNPDLAEANAATLKAGALADPETYKREAKFAAEQMAVDSLAVFFLLGVPLPPPSSSFGEGALLLEVLAGSGHDKIIAHAALGSLEDFLADPQRHRRTHRVSQFAQKAMAYRRSLKDRQTK